MSDTRSQAASVADAIRRRTRYEAAAVGLRLARSVAARFDGADRQALEPALAFARDFAAGRGVRDDNEAQWREEIRAARAADLPHPLSRIAKVASRVEHGHLIADLVLLSVLPELHEGYAALFRALHPQAQPHPTVALALHWLEHEAPAATAADPAVVWDRALAVREPLEDLLVHSPLARVGLVRTEGEGPWHGRTLRPGPGAWDALNARAPRLAHAALLPGLRAVPGLDAWLARPDVRQAARALGAGEPCLVAVIGESAAMRATRLRAVLGAAGLGAVRVGLTAAMGESERANAAIDAYCAAFLHRACPWLEIEGDPVTDAVPFAPGRDLAWDLPVLASAATERGLPVLDLPIFLLRAEPLSAVARRRMWDALLPQLGAGASVLAARYPIDPEEARGVVSDLALRQRTAEEGGAAFGLDDIGECLRSRTGWHARPGVRRVIPRAQWSDLLLPRRASVQLTEAVLRIHQQLTVLDDWGFEQGRNDRRGLRLLFYGPPGTGKTLAAEAMARALGVDLLAVDLASLVSKWIGETEKNLAAVFEVAERSRSLLFFDEADALFARRTDVQDSNDRYANLETAFLLQRLERYEGVAVLATNLRASVDAAFTRRFEFIVEFPEPDLEARERLWRLHLPEGAPLADDVDLPRLAEWYAISGAQIRNAALGAAFFAAAESREGEPAIGQRHFLRAIEREFDKAGKAHPGNPPERTPEAPRAPHSPVNAHP
ncbi:hypothetical protein BWI17_06315 [Betaproteobacteria bacterium GR16-43]|nr:hypothetical protein BWI17_06315 [Betaproteobacteria bacterium GR16-43]